MLAHDLLATAEHDVDVRYLLAGLAASNPGCWAYAVDGLVGATPELLVSRDGDQVFSRVLAGTMPRGGDRTTTGPGSAELVGSAKDQQEHRYAVESLVEALGPHVTGLQAPAEPGVLELSNVSHLVTDVTARLDDSSHVLDLLAALHPTAAVGGTPREAALTAIAELEGMHRGRYAGATGWVDAAGDGEWGIALRCAQVERPHRAAVRRLRHRRRLRPRRRGARGAGQVRAGARRPRRQLTRPRLRWRCRPPRPRRR